MLTRDFLAALVAAAIAYYGLVNQELSSVELRLAFVEPLAAAAAAAEAPHRELHNDDERRLPLPLIVDLDGDGTTEIVVATRVPPMVRVLEVPLAAVGDTRASKSVPRARVRYRASLLTAGVRVAKGRRPVALATGALTADSRSIVVLTDGWCVLCFNQRLVLQWENVVRQPRPRLLGISASWIREAALLVLPSRVVVGASSRSRAVKGTWFSAYALEGSRGRIVWKRAAAGAPLPPEPPPCHGRYRRALAAALALHPHVWAHRADTAIFSRSNFVADEDEEEHTRSADAAATRRTASLAAAASIGHYVANADQTRLSAAAPQPRLTTATFAQTLIFYTKRGVVVRRLDDGAAVCAEPFFPPSRTKISWRTTADVNGDGVVDRVASLQSLDLPSLAEYYNEESDGAVAGSKMTVQNLVHCVGVATTHVVPHRFLAAAPGDTHEKEEELLHALKSLHHRRRQHQLYNASLCHRGHGSLSEAMLLSLDAAAPTNRGHGAERIAATRARNHMLGMFKSVETVPPALLRRDRSPIVAGALPQLFGGNAPRHETLVSRRGRGGTFFDAVFAVSTGLVTAINPIGTVLWQSFTKATWDTNLEKKVSATHLLRLVPSATPLTLFPAATTTPSHVLVIGDHVAVLLERESGTKVGVASIPAPCAPTGRPAVGDLDNDGVGDIVLVGRGAICAYVAVASKSTIVRIMSFFVGLLLALLLLSIALAALTAKEEEEEEGFRVKGGAYRVSSRGGRRKPPAGGARSPLARMRRSTS